MQESPYVGGNFHYGANAGLRCWNLNNSPGNANINIGARHILAKLRTKYRTILSIPLGKNKVVTEGFSRLILEKPLDAKEKEVIIYKKRSLNYKDSAAMLSYLGWLKHSNSYNYYLKNIKPYVNINEMKEVVRNESRKRNQAKII